MTTETITIPADVASHVLFHYGHRGIPASDWTQSLITLIDRADMIHRAKLAAAFPEYGAAVLLAKYDEDGIAHLQAIARGHGTTGPLGCTRCGNTDGPFTHTGLCEDCADGRDAETELLSALEDGGHLDDNARRLLDAYAALVLKHAGASQ